MNTMTRCIQKSDTSFVVVVTLLLYLALFQAGVVFPAVAAVVVSIVVLESRLSENKKASILIMNIPLVLFFWVIHVQNMPY